MKKFVLDYTKSLYWTDYVNLKDADFYDANPGAHEVRRKHFESRIRMPLRLFQDLLREMEDDPCMQERDDMAIPLRMKLAASLRFLALGCPWAGLEEIFRVSALTLRTWFQDKFLPWMMKNKYGAYVKYPLTHDELAKAVELFLRAGFPGLCGLSDGVHVRLYRCFNASVKARFVGSKKMPTVVWNVTVDYYGRPIFVSIAAPGSTNDKGIVQTHDMFMRRVLMKNDVYTGFEYKLARQMGAEGGEASASVSTVGTMDGAVRRRVSAPPVRHGGLDVVESLRIAAEEGRVLLWDPEEAVQHPERGHLRQQHDAR